MTKGPRTSIDTLARPLRTGPQARDDVIRVAIRLGLLALLVYWCFILVQPFIAILVWSIILAVALYPPYSWLVDRIGGRRRIAAAIVTILSFVVVAAPVIWLGAGVVEGAGDVVENLSSGTWSIPPPHESVRNWPLIGEYIHDLWSSAFANLKSVLRDIAPYITQYAGSILGTVGGVGVGILKFLAALVVAGFLFAPAPRLLEATRSFLIRLVPERGDEFISLAGMTIRSVSQGVIGISVVQSVLAGIGLKLVGIPSAGLLAFLILVSGVLQIGAAVFIIPAIIWVWMTNETATAVLFTAYMVPVGLLDNILKPIIMARGLKTPAVVILVGVIGGTLAHGIVGLFVGPVVLAVGWTLVAAWLTVKADPESDDLQSLSREPPAGDSAAAR